MIRYNPETNQTIILDDNNVGMLLSGDHRLTVDHSKITYEFDLNSPLQTTWDSDKYDFGIFYVLDKWFVLDDDKWIECINHQNAIDCAIDIHFPVLVSDIKTNDIFEVFSN